VLACSGQLNCTKVTCGTNTAPACYTYTAASNSAVSSKCSSGTYCPFSYSNFTMNYACQAEATPVVTYHALPGMYCNTTLQCVSGVTCSSNKCVGLSSGTNCTTTSQCKQGYYCKNATCTALLAAGATCDYFTDYCTYGYECNSGKCEKILSIAPGSAVDHALCSSAGYSYMCRYAECYDVNTTYSICINPMKNGAAYNTPCTTCEGSAVTGNFNYSRTASCACGLGGASYCPGFQGDEYGSKAFELGRKYLLSDDASKCSIVAGLSCMQYHWNSDDYYEFTYYNYLSTERWRIIGAESCLYEHLDQGYTYIKNKYDDAESSSSGELLAFSALLLSLVA